MLDSSEEPFYEQLRASLNSDLQVDCTFDQLMRPMKPSASPEAPKSGRHYKLYMYIRNTNNETVPHAFFLHYFVAVFRL